MSFSLDNYKKENVHDNDWRASPWADAAQETAQSSLNTLLGSSEIIVINGVRLEARDFGAPTQEQIREFGLVELEDGELTDLSVPQYKSYTFDNYDLFKLAYPHYADLNLDETQARKKWIFPVTVWYYNDPAIELMLGGRREPNDEEWEKLVDYARANGGNKALIKVMNSWFVGCHLAASRSFSTTNDPGWYQIGEWVIFGCSGKIPSKWLYNGTWWDNTPAVGMGNVSTLVLRVIRAIASENNAALKNPLASSEKSI